MNRSESEAKDQFSKLPDDLFVLILTKIRQQDFKFLSRCSLISKLFASSIPLMPSVSISISPPNTPKPTSDFSKSSLQDVADRFIDRKMDYLTSLRPQIQKALIFLKKFTMIRALDVVFITDDDDEDDPKEGGFRYGANGGSHGCNQPGSRKGGKICLTAQEILDLRNSLSPEDVSRISGNGNGIGVTINVKSAYIPVLRLPSSGYAMKSVSLVVVRVGRRLYHPGDEAFPTETDTETDSDSDDDHEDGQIEYDDNDIINWEFDSEEEVFREAVTLILVDHKDKMQRET
ncbi:unnamed protein product [Lactuca virosa]|uniref:F-box domain-containing protein n=1 Tax=Lactuca virosa TaxID=75947 RepID=A0AAU9MZ81_9ASTR|nr:unnamed protein product [Lactuca virosa]